MDGRRYGQIVVAQNQTRLKSKAPIGTVLKEFYGIPDQMLTATHHGTMFMHARTDKLYDKRSSHPKETYN